MAYKCIRNANVLLHKNNKYLIEQHDLIIYDGKIEAFDIFVEDAEIIDMKGKLIVPCFFNMHCHLGESIFRNIQGGYWTIEKYIEYTNHYNCSLSKEQQEKKWTESAQYSIKEMEKVGILGICAARCSNICNEYGFYNMSGYPLMNSIKLNHFKNKGIDGFVEYCELNRSDQCSVGIFYHSLYMNDRNTLRLANNTLERGAEFFTVHISEDVVTTQKERKMYGKNAIYTLDEYDLLNKNTILVHCGYTTQDELELIAKKGASISVCPISNQFLNTKMPNINMLEELGINWFVSTDGVATGRDFSLAKQAAEIKKKFCRISYDRLFFNITEGPAQLYNRNGYTGRIEVGVDANFLVFNCEETNKNYFFEGLFNGRYNIEACFKSK